MNYLDEVADRIRAKVPPGLLPEDDTTDLFRLYAVALLAKGTAVTAADVHNAWVAWTLTREPEHESAIPFEQLDAKVAAEDEPFVQAIHDAANELLGSGAHSGIDAYLFPHGKPEIEEERHRLFELYKIMVSSSEALVGRRQGVNTFFLTINGAILTAVGLVLSNGNDQELQAAGVLVLGLTGFILSLAWNSLIRSFGQLNKGKFAVINRIEQDLPAAIFLAEWKALGEGANPSVYRTFTSREVWTPRAFAGSYILTVVLALLVATGVWSPN